MIDLHIDRGHLRRCCVNGDLSTIAREFGVAISSIYGQLLKRSSADNAAQFKFLIQLTACDDSPVWDDMLGDLPAMFAAGPAADAIRRASEKGGQQHDDD